MTTSGPAGAGSASPYIADTNVYVMAANDAAFRAELEEFIRDRGPLLVSAIVVAEILIGIPDVSQHRLATRALGAGAEILAPDPDDWTRAGTAIAQLGGEAITKSRSFWNDTLLAAQCSRLEITLITHNAADFRRLGRYLAVRTVSPFP